MRVIPCSQKVPGARAVGKPERASVVAAGVPKFQGANALRRCVERVIHLVHGPRSSAGDFRAEHVVRACKRVGDHAIEHMTSIEPGVLGEERRGCRCAQVVDRERVVYPSHGHGVGNSVERVGVDMRSCCGDCAARRRSGGVCDVDEPRCRGVGDKEVRRTVDCHDGHLSVWNGVGCRALGADGGRGVRVGHTEDAQVRVGGGKDYNVRSTVDVEALNVDEGGANV